MVEQGYASATLSGEGGAHQAGGSSAEDDRVELFGWGHGKASVSLGEGFDGSGKRVELIVE